MRKTILIAVFATIAIAASAKILTDHLARPKKMEGFQIYVLSEPVDDYEKIGYVKIKAAWTGAPDEMVKLALKKAQKEYPTGDAIIFTSDDMGESMVIKFK